MDDLIATLTSSPPVVTDGAWGTLLQAQGLQAGECPDGWNLTHPDRVSAVAAQYVEAGSAVVLTNTFRGNRISLDSCGLGSRTREINRMGVQISKSAAGNSAFVFASIGPSGKVLVTGDVSEAELSAAYHEQAEVLAESGADAIVIETMTDLTEALLALKAAKATGLPVVVSMVFDSGKDRGRTMMGTTVEQAAAALVGAGADAIGANCGVGIEPYVAVCARLKASTRVPVWIKPNAGLPEIVRGMPIYRTTPEEFARFALRLRDSGATFIGGCCGTTPEFIRTVHRKFQETPPHSA